MKMQAKFGTQEVGDRETVHGLLIFILPQLFCYWEFCSYSTEDNLGIWPPPTASQARRQYSCV